MKYINFAINYIQLFFKLMALSLYSTDFYKDVYKSFSGWGIRYIFTAIFIATLMYIVPIFYTMEKLRDYFVYDKMSEDVKDIDYIFSQLPTLTYNGSVITLEEDEPYYIYNLQGSPVLVIDTKAHNHHNYKDEKLIMSANSIILNKNYTKLSGDKALKLEYTKIFGEAPAILSLIEIKKLLGDIFEQAIKVFIYILFPISLFLSLFFVMLQKLFNIIIVYIFLNMFVGKTLIRDAFRLVMFASAVPVILAMLPQSFGILKGVSSMVELWSLILMVFSLYKIKA